MIVAFPFLPAVYDSLSSTFLPPLSVANLCNFSHFKLWNKIKYLITLICISPMVNGPEDLFKGLFVTHMPFLKYQFVSFVKQIAILLNVIRHLLSVYDISYRFLHSIF